MTAPKKVPPRSTAGTRYGRESGETGSAPFGSVEVVGEDASEVALVLVDVDEELFVAEVVPGVGVLYHRVEKQYTKAWAKYDME